MGTKEKIKEKECEIPQRIQGWEKIINSIERRRNYRDYHGMIKTVLALFPQGQATMKEIYESVEEYFSSDLQWKYDPDSKRVPVWKAKIRNILLGLDMNNTNTFANGSGSGKPFVSTIRNNKIYFQVKS